MSDMSPTLRSLEMHERERYFRERARREQVGKAEDGNRRWLRRRGR